jgi:serine protease inhibitor
MKISKEKLQKIIKEELEMAQNTSEMSYSGPKTGSKIDDLEGKMAKNQLIHIAKYAIAMAKGLEENQELESWVQSKITLAEDYISKVKHYLETELQVEFDDPDIDNLLQNSEIEPEEKKNYAGEGKFYYDI